jgi:hypothetical protein
MPAPHSRSDDVDRLVGADPSPVHPHQSIAAAELALSVDGEFDDSPILRPLLEEVPEFLPTYVALASACGDEPGEPSVLMELADFVADHLSRVRRERLLLERVLAIVEAHLESIADDEEGCELMAFAFFDTFAPELRKALVPVAGPLSRLLIEGLDAPGAQDEH